MGYKCFMEKNKLHFNSRAIHGGQRPDKAYGAVMPPIYQTSTFAQDAPGKAMEYAYSRVGNPTRSALEASLASLENGTHAMAFASGLAAIDAIMKLLTAGDEVVSTNNLYGGTYRFFTQIMERYGVHFTFLDMADTQALEAAITNKTKLLWVETPTNPMMNILDLRTIATIAERKGVLMAVDNTFATPYLQRPLDFGAHIVMHSLTKYLAGHSDVVAGGIVVKDKILAERLYFVQKASGGICGPMDAYLTLRGIKTLSVRMERHCVNAAEIAFFLREHAAVSKVYWPGFEEHPEHGIAREQMSGFGAMISFVPKDADADRQWPF